MGKRKEAASTANPATLEATYWEELRSFLASTRIFKEVEYPNDTALTNKLKRKEQVERATLIYLGGELRKSAVREEIQSLLEDAGFVPPHTTGTGRVKKKVPGAWTSPTLAVFKFTHARASSSPSMGLGRHDGLQRLYAHSRSRFA